LLRKNLPAFVFCAGAQSHKLSRGFGWVAGLAEGEPLGILLRKNLPAFVFCAKGAKPQI
jgi:hypothetical protein